ncbi:hypothetical protein CUMW_127530 [Citrus unshiu]|uniref:Uncharacterized protein n=1 Tax=Citrus unshiu TaxID=55188 RepID=A0A2H5PDX2_CITUN|nr:hypothetical protein CUMW_127530 [Citrus unshiu]
MASSSNSSQQEAVMRKQNNGPPYKFLVPLIYAPVLPLIRIGLRKNPVVRDRLFTAVLAGAFAHGFYLVFWQTVGEHSKTGLVDFFMLAPNPVCTILLCALLIYWEEEKENRNSVDAVWVLMGAVNLVLLKNGQVIYQVQKKAGRNRGVYEPEELGSGREGMGTEF